MGKGNELDNDLGIGGRLKYGAVVLEFLFNNPRIGKISVVGYSKVAFYVFYDQRLCIAEVT